VDGSSVFAQCKHWLWTQLSVWSLVITHSPALPHFRCILLLAYTWVNGLLYAVLTWWVCIAPGNLIGQLLTKLPSPAACLCPLSNCSCECNSCPLCVASVFYLSLSVWIRLTASGAKCWTFTGLPGTVILFFAMLSALAVFFNSVALLVLYVSNNDDMSCCLHVDTYCFVSSE